MCVFTLFFYLALKQQKNVSFAFHNIVFLKLFIYKNYTTLQDNLYIKISCVYKLWDALANWWWWGAPAAACPIFVVTSHANSQNYVSFKLNSGSIAAVMRWKGEKEKRAKAEGRKWLFSRAAAYTEGSCAHFYTIFYLAFFHIFFPKVKCKQAAKRCEKIHFISYDY